MQHHCSRGATRICLTPFRHRNSLKSALMNCGPLSVTTLRKLKRANTCRKTVIVAAAVVDDIGRISDHFEWASTITKKYCSSLFAKLRCTTCHGFPGNIHVTASTVRLSAVLVVSAGNLHTDKPKFRCVCR